MRNNIFLERKAGPRAYGPDELSGSRIFFPAFPVRCTMRMQRPGRVNGGRGDFPVFSCVRGVVYYNLPPPPPPPRQPYVFYFHFFFFFFPA